MYGFLEVEHSRVFKASPLRPFYLNQKSSGHNRVYSGGLSRKSLAIFQLSSTEVIEVLIGRAKNMVCLYTWLTCNIIHNCFRMYSWFYIRVVDVLYIIPNVLQQNGLTFRRYQVFFRKWCATIKIIFLTNMWSWASPSSTLSNVLGY